VTDTAIDNSISRNKPRRLADGPRDAVTRPLGTDFTLFTDEVIDRGWITNRDNEQRDIPGAVSKMEARTLANLVRDHGCRRCLETGVAYGVSTLAITQAVAANGGHHYGIDPCQITDHREAAICLLEEHNLAQHFTLLEGPSHTEFPKLLTENESSFDFVFVDGMHTFDYKLLDYFFADKMLKVGGWLVFHDLWLSSVKKVFRFIQTQGTYEFQPEPELSASWPRSARLLAGAFIKQRPLWYYWPASFSNLLILRKVADHQLPWNHFKQF